MIGRTEQLERIMSAIDALGAVAPGSGASGAGAPVASTAANVLFVTGEAGIGKSTLLAAVRRECAARRTPPVVALAECSTPLAGQDIGEVESLQPWGEIMASLVTAQPERRHETTKLVGELALAWVRVIPVVGDVIESLADTTKIVRSHMGKDAAPASAASQQQIFQQYVNFLTKLAERGPLVLMIDDAHWADTASTNLLFAAARQLHGLPVLFIVAYRPDDAASSRGGEGHPLLHIRNELERYDLALDIDVPRMTALDLDALLHQRYPSYQNNDAFEEWIARVSSGNALFIAQFLHTLEEDGFIDPVAGTIREGFESIRVPGSAAAVVKERIRRLSEDAREMLRYASVEGDTFTSAILARITELPQLKLLQRLRLLEESHRIIRALGKQRIYSRETSAFQFGHALLHKAMYEDLGEEERELLHEAVLDVLKEEWEIARSEGANIEGIAARIAVHARVLGQHRLAAEVLLDGAKAAWHEYAAEESLRMIDDALASLEVAAGAGAKRAELDRLRGIAHLHRADVLRTCARFAESIADSDRAREAFDAAGDSTGVVDAINSAARTILKTGDSVEAGRRALEATTMAETIDYARGRVQGRATLGNAMVSRSEFEAALEEYRASLAHAEAAGLRYEQAAAHDNLGSVYDSIGDYARARDHIGQSIATLRELGERLGEAQATLNMGVLDMRVGEFERARGLLERALGAFTAAGDVIHENAVLINLGILALHDGQLDAAQSYTEQALAIAQRIGDRRTEASAYSTIGEVRLAARDLPAALENFTRSLELHGETQDREGMAIAHINLADVHASAGRAAEARHHAVEACAIATAIGSPFLVAMAEAGRGHADAIEARTAGEAERAGLLDSAVRIIRTAVEALEGMESPYAETWRTILADIESGAQVAPDAAISSR